MQVPNGRFKQTKATKEMWKAKDKDSGGNPGLVVMGDQSCPKVVGSNPGTVYLMDIWTFFTLICCKICIV